MKIHHLALRTRDLVRLRAFYADTLGLATAKEDGERSVWLSAGDAIVMLERADESEPPVPERTRELVAFAIEPEETSDLEARLARRGVPIEARTEFTLYFRDPDGRRVGASHYPRPAAPSRNVRS